MGVFDRKTTMSKDHRPSPTVGASSSPSLFDQPTATRKEAIHRLNALNNDTLTDRHEQILDALEELGPSTMKQVAEHIKLPINCVTGRFKELRDYEPKRIMKDGKTVHPESGYSAWKYKLIPQAHEQ